MEYLNFKSFEELCENVSRGGEIEFLYRGMSYSICPCNEKVYVTEAYNLKTEKIYDTPEAIGEYVIEGKKLKDILDEIIVTFRCF